MKRTLSPPRKTAQAFVPGHITGIFRIFDDARDPLQRGSKGAGFSISAGTLTSVTIRKDANQEITTTYNGKIIEAAVTRTVVERIMEEQNASHSVEVVHSSELPIGVGFGASGAGALGTALSLTSLLDSNFNYVSAAQHAHHAEVLNRAGLGDVIAQSTGGIEVRTRPGAPGIGKLINLSQTNDSVVVLAGATGLETRSVLTNPLFRERINNTADSLLNDLAKEPSLDKIVRYSRKFANEIGLMTDRIRNALSELESSGFEDASMVMLGDSIFCLCDPRDVISVESILMNYWASDEILHSTISDSGGKLIK